MTERINVSSGRPWEDEVGYSRAVRVGNLVEVSATAASTVDGTIAYPGDIGAQARHIFGVIEEALAEVGASLADVVRATYWIRDMESWPILGEVHRERLGAHRPTITFAFTNGWPFPGEEIEIQMTAYLQD